MNAGGVERADICAADDYAGRDRLRVVLAELGFLGNTDHLDDWEPVGVGLTLFRRGAAEVTVFADAYLVDLAGPPGCVAEIVAALAGHDYE